MSNRCILLIGNAGSGKDSVFSLFPSDRFVNVKLAACLKEAVKSIHANGYEAEIFEKVEYKDNPSYPVTIAVGKYEDYNLEILRPLEFKTPRQALLEVGKMFESTCPTWVIDRTLEMLDKNPPKGIPVFTDVRQINQYVALRKKYSGIVPVILYRPGTLDIHEMELAKITYLALSEIGSPGILEACILNNCGKLTDLAETIDKIAKLLI